MKEYERNHRGHREKNNSLPTPRFWQTGLCSQKKHKEKVYETTRFHEITTEKQMIYRLKGLNKEDNLVKICVNLWLLS